MLLVYDDEADTLEIYFDKIREGHFKEMGNKLFKRIDKKTGKTVGYSIFNFSKRKEHVEFNIPLPQELFAH